VQADLRELRADQQIVRRPLTGIRRVRQLQLQPPNRIRRIGLILNNIYCNYNDNCH
jgi:hypothetical protein